MDLIYRFEPSQWLVSCPVPDAAAALLELQKGNERLAGIVARMQDQMSGGAACEPIVIPVCPVSLGLPLAAGMSHNQAPFGLVLGCSDARVPTEVIFDQSFNHLFVVRIAGNVLGTECVGSIDFAVRHLADSLKVVVVLGHSRCGAVTAAVAGYEAPEDYIDIAFSHGLRSLVDRIQIAVRGAAKALRQVAGNDVARCPGYTKALVEMTAYLNAAVTASDLQREVRGLEQSNLPVVYGVFDLDDLRVRAIPDAPGMCGVAERMTFAEAPKRADEFVALAARLAERVVARGMLQ